MAILGVVVEQLAKSRAIIERIVVFIVFSRLIDFCLRHVNRHWGSLGVGEVFLKKKTPMSHSALIALVRYFGINVCLHWQEAKN